MHIPEGATPKDGPSAGITMCLALISALTKNPTRADVAMTGEITLRGRVLAIGGLKEKILAAKQQGIKVVIVPDENKDDVEEIRKDIGRIEGLDIVFVKSMDEVLARALVNDPFHHPKRKKRALKKMQRKNWHPNMLARSRRRRTRKKRVLRSLLQKSRSSLKENKQNNVRLLIRGAQAPLSFFIHISRTIFQSTKYQ